MPVPLTASIVHLDLSLSFVILIQSIFIYSPFVFHRNTHNQTICFFFFVANFEYVQYPILCRVQNCYCHKNNVNLHVISKYNREREREK